MTRLSNTSALCASFREWLWRDSTWRSPTSAAAALPKPKPNSSSSWLSGSTPTPTSTNQPKPAGRCRTVHPQRRHSAGARLAWSLQSDNLRAWGTGGLRRFQPLPLGLERLLKDPISAADEPSAARPQPNHRRKDSNAESEEEAEPAPACGGARRKRRNLRWGRRIQRVYKNRDTCGGRSRDIESVAAAGALGLVAGRVSG